MSVSQKRLAIFLPALYGGGAERATLNLICEVADRGYIVDLVLAQAKGPLMAEVPESARVFDLRAYRVLASLPGLVSYLRHERPEVMFSVMNHANIITLWARRLAGVRMRVVVGVRNTLSSATKYSTSLRGRMMPMLIRRYYPHADAIVAVSKGVANDLNQVTGIPREHIRVIYNPIVTPALREKAQAPLNHPWFKPGQPPVLLAVGRLVAQKDFPTLIHAFARVRNTRSAKLLILGEGQDRHILEELIKELGLEIDVSLPGYDMNPYAYMSRASVFILSSRWEGLPGVLIEALYCGAPLISTDCPSGPREILVNGRYGQLVPVGDAAEMARAIEKSLEGEAEKPPHESWLPFAMETVVSQYIDMLLGC